MFGGMDKQEAAELLDLIIERAPGLRAAGIRAVNLGGASFTLAPPELGPTSEPDQKDEADPPADMLRDPWTHGRPGPGAPTSLVVKRHKV